MTTQPLCARKRVLDQGLKAWKTTSNRSSTPDRTATVTVTQTITTVDHQPVVGDVKSSRSRRRVELGAETVRVLREHRKVQVEERSAMGAGYHDHDLVFAKPTRECWNPDSIGPAFERAVERSGLPRIRFHDLRHSHASHLIAAGANVKVVSSRLGHAFTFTLDRYGHLMPGQDGDAATAVEAMVDAL